MIRSCQFCYPIQGGGVRYHEVVLDEPLAGFQEWGVIEVTENGKTWTLWKDYRDNVGKHDAIIHMEYKPTVTYDRQLLGSRT